eukprot:CAMPEP_0117622336 /NCGR_PEP_ID=MMETSP0784-20121206/88088_1 /TAXON_ID=39447 /ORGANISM="" /LENGTH=225 /DNA_ID=CAMNT_0005426271 /DNA_START=268 /DNA_END=946 /DNA_ORIENTATION=-
MLRVDMPVTPLAAAMWRYGWLPEGAGSAKTVIEDHRLDLPTGEPNPVSLRSSGTTPVVVEHTSTRKPVSCESMKPPCAHVESEPGLGARVACYESRDASGRVWGMPSAFGRGQCLSCPNKAAPPSLWCEKCQLASAAGCEMSDHDLQCLQRSLNILLQELTGRAHDDIAKRLGQLYSKLTAGGIAMSIQDSLLDIARAIEAKDRATASRIASSLKLNIGASTEGG